MKKMQCQACGCEKECFICDICGTDAPSMARLDRLTKEHTACKTFAEFVGIMKKEGDTRQTYTPTIYPNNTSGRKVVGKVELIEAVRRAGFRVYDGIKVA